MNEDETPAQRRMRFKAMALKRWAKCPDRSAATHRARYGLFEKYEREVDPAGLLEPAERAKRAQMLYRAFFAELALKSAKKRQDKKRGSTA